MYEERGRALLKEFLKKEKKSQVGGCKVLKTYLVGRCELIIARSKGYRSISAQYIPKVGEDLLECQQ